MGKKMDKKNVIWGEQHSVSLAGFNNAHLTSILDLIKQKVGPNVVVNRSALQAAINKAKSNPKMKNGYVKVGLIGSDLVVRAKEKKFLGDIEVDAILVKTYPAKVQAWKVEKLRLDMEELERVAAVNENKRRLAEQTRIARLKMQQEQEQAQRQEEQRKAKSERLHKVMNTPDDEGVTMRDKILRAAKNAQKLGVGDYAKGKLKEQGLTPMDERYHGEAIDPKNRYGRYMPELRALWEQHASKLQSYTKWLDDAEAGRVGVPGVSEALALRKPKGEGGGPIIDKGEVAGGRVLYLDDEARQAYAARVSKGVISGGQPAGDNTIFVIGSDNKIYIGGKQRGGGKKSAFNHSSFFSGGPVRSAGSLKLSGSRIIEVNDVSGHYTPNKAMVVTAVRKFAGGDKAWLADVDVKIGTAAPVKGAALLGEDHEKTSNEVWGKYSAGAVSRAAAALVLMSAADGNWLVREGSNQQLVISFRKGDNVGQDLITNVATNELDRKKLLPPDQVKKLLAALPKTTTPPKPKPQPEPLTPPRRSEEREQRETQTEQQPVVRRAPSKWLPPAGLVDTAHSSPGWHGVMNSERAAPLLANKPAHAWLLRENKDKFVTLSRVLPDGKRILHTLINTQTNYETMLEHIQAHPNEVVRP